MPVTVLLFGPLAHVAGVRSLAVEGETCGELRAAILRARPDVGPALKAARFAVNQSFAADDSPVATGDEVALIPPVSGGSW